MYPLNANRAPASRRVFHGTRPRGRVRATRPRLSGCGEHAQIRVRPCSWLLAAALAGVLVPGLAAAQEHDDASRDVPRPWTTGHSEQGGDSRSATGAADASSPWDATVGLGVGMRPTYEGSDEYKAVPAAWIDITYDDWLSFGPDGLNAYWHTGGLRIGGGVTSFHGRNDSDSSDLLKRGDDRLKGMGDLDGSPAARVFVAYQWGRVHIGGSVTRAIGSSNDDVDDLEMEGTRADFGVSIPFSVTDKLTLTTAAGVTWADDKYTQALFGVTPLQSKRSGFAAYEAESGVKSVDLAFGASYQFSEHWSLMMLLHGEKLVGDAADSPIVFSDTNASFITTVNYHF